MMRAAVWVALLLLVGCADAAVGAKTRPMGKRLVVPDGAEEGFERQLRASLTHNYTHMRPPTVPLHLDVKLIVKELINLDVKSEELQMMCWVRLIWHDPRLQWDVQSFVIREIRLLPHQIWTPDIIVSTSAQPLVRRSSLPATLSSDGVVYWFSPINMRTKCKSDVTFFPFDKQTCLIDISSWTHPSHAINLDISSYSTILEDHHGNIQWKITRIAPSLSHYNATDDSFSSFNFGSLFSKITYEITLSRKPDFYIYVIFVPVAMCVILGFLTFLIPADNGAKLGFPMSLYLALTVNQLVISAYVPPSADAMPIVTSLCTYIGALFGVNVLQTAIVLRIFHTCAESKYSMGSPTAMRFLSRLEKLGYRSLLYTRVDRFPARRVGFNSVVIENKERLSRISRQEQQEIGLPNSLENQLEAMTSIISIMARNELRLSVQKKWHIVAAGIDVVFLTMHTISIVAIFIHLAFRCLTHSFE